MTGIRNPEPAHAGGASVREAKPVKVSAFASGEIGA